MSEHVKEVLAWAAVLALLVLVGNVLARRPWPARPFYGAQTEPAYAPRLKEQHGPRRPGEELKPLPVPIEAR